MPKYPTTAERFKQGLFPDGDLQLPFRPRRSSDTWPQHKYGGRVGLIDQNGKLYGYGAEVLWDEIEGRNETS